MSIIESTNPAIYIFAETRHDRGLGPPSTRPLSHEWLTILVNGVTDTVILMLPYTQAALNTVDHPRADAWLSIVRGPKLRQCGLRDDQNGLLLQLVLAYSAFVKNSPAVQNVDFHLFVDTLSLFIGELDAHDSADPLLFAMSVFMLDIIPEVIYPDQDLLACARAALAALEDDANVSPVLASEPVLTFEPTLAFEPALASMPTLASAPTPASALVSAPTPSSSSTSTLTPTPALTLGSALTLALAPASNLAPTPTLTSAPTLATVLAPALALTATLTPTPAATLTPGAPATTLTPVPTRVLVTVSTIAPAAAIAPNSEHSGVPALTTAVRTRFNDAMEAAYMGSGWVAVAREDAGEDSDGSLPPLRTPSDSDDESDKYEDDGW
ncbi:uncharacterized protein BXZ73DRAFT_108689 [Epithele typhae]|uniref:uncharacterized protein n=1 Tax=Epithele typhae TaxID=378194 RepID=UPI002008C1DA|nr:uncharacterized protein BXZ73DRAFT_108689 [Epithele typhae]KAH9910653.1 hypothetical protein BXZ73DRAFT_108689 [Epithele typhae]